MKQHLTHTKGFWALLLLGIVLFSSCGDGGLVESKKKGDNTAVLHQLSDPDYLNPIISSSSNATYIEFDLFQPLLEIDPKTLQFVGALVIDRPQISEINEGEYKGGMSLVYEIRPEATWDNGTPVTGNDVVFTIKSVKCPKVNSDPLRPYFEFINDIVVDAQNPKKFTIFSKQRYALAETAGNNFIIPEYVYDPQGLLKPFTIKQLTESTAAQKLANNPSITAFAEQMNSPKYSREKGFIIGSGPYQFVNWETGQQIILERKKNWWGDKLNLPQLSGKPDKIVYKIINDWTTAVTGMKDEALDCANGIRSSDFVDLQKNERFKKLFNLHTPTALAYDYLAFNLKNPKVNDKRVRRAIAHLVDKKEIIDVLLYGMGEPVVGPVHPTKEYYNKDLQNIEFDVEKAKALLKEAGWEDTDGDGVVDKEIDGKRTPMKLTVKYNSGNDRRKNICLLLKETAKRAGVEVEVLTREWTVFLDEQKKRDFDITCGGWVQSPTLDDLKQIWHSESDTPEGSNFVGFGTPESDRLIEAVRMELDPAKQIELFKQIQTIIHEEQPYVFLVSPKERIAIHSRFEAETSIKRPGYDEKTFVLKQAQ